ncbi:of mitochondria protein 6 [Seminavis robusta]|uniref:Altered inheritance of mitochondria protein 6 n=1 Tax=Seminavis robusta TaxID=568900 RepID=A0A9N8ECJ9_9STRA|nr:of mitochondria protein 6 [Seminavis robusta]|eukprot:Sro891_g216870.1 of mitochondria protein 6 (292) ;mRNA; f:38420-39295
MCRAHSHNDYHQANPLSSALHHGLNSIEVDVFPKHDGSLLVAHTVLDLDPRRTIETMYIQPILGIFKKQRQPEDSTPSAAQPTGRSPVESRKSPSHRALTPQGGDPEGRLQQTRMPSNHRLPRRVDRLNLLVDFKGDADKSASLLQTALTPLRPYLSKVDKNGVFKPGRLTVVISGNRPRADSLKAPNGERFLFLDGRVKDVRANAQTDLVPLISVPWRQVRFARAVGRGDQFMRRLTERAHSQGKLVRIWGAPNKETAWGKMLRSNIDLLSIDDHPKFAQFVAEENKAKS